MRREHLFQFCVVVGLIGAIAVGAGCTGSGSTGPGGNTNPTPTPAIPAGIYYVNAGTNPNRVAAFNSAPIASGGVPSPLPNSPYLGSASSISGAPFGMALAKGGTVLYEVNYDSSSVDAFTVNPDGTLVTPQLGTVTTAGTLPQGICINPASTFAAVVDSGSNQVETYSIGGTGMLTFAHMTAIGQNGLNTPADCAFSPSGATLYVTNTVGGTGISEFSVDGSGNLTTLASSPNGAATTFQGIAVSSAGIVFAASQAQNGVGVFAIAPGGQLVVSFFSNTATAPIGVALRPNGQTLYLACAGSQAVDAYAVGVGGALTRVNGAPFQTQAVQSAYLSVNGAGNLLVVVDVLNSGVTIFAIQSDGSLGYAPANVYGINVVSSKPEAVVAR
jgi:6-phosphogluconolactonase (cycloisomerase 2 family)